MSQKLTISLQIHFFPEIQFFPEFQIFLENHILTGKSYFPENHNSREVNSHNWLKMVIYPKNRGLLKEKEEKEKEKNDL